MKEENAGPQSDELAAAISDALAPIEVELVSIGDAVVDITDPRADREHIVDVVHRLKGVHDILTRTLVLALGLNLVDYRREHPSFVNWKELDDSIDDIYSQ